MIPINAVRMASDPRYILYQVPDPAAPVLSARGPAPGDDGESATERDADAKLAPEGAGGGTAPSGAASPPLSILAPERAGQPA